MVASGKLRTKPKFIRSDREATLSRIFSHNSLNCSVLFNEHAQASKNEIMLRLRRIVNSQPVWINAVVMELMFLRQEKIKELDTSLNNQRKKVDMTPYWRNKSLKKQGTRPKTTESRQ